MKTITVMVYIKGVGSWFLHRTGKKNSVSVVTAKYGVKKMGVLHGANWVMEMNAQSPNLQAIATVVTGVLAGNFDQQDVCNHWLTDDVNLAVRVETL